MRIGAIDDVKAGRGQGGQGSGGMDAWKASLDGQGASPPAGDGGRDQTVAAGQQQMKRLGPEMAQHVKAADCQGDGGGVGPAGGAMQSGPGAGGNRGGQNGAAAQPVAAAPSSGPAAPPSAGDTSSPAPPAGQAQGGAAPNSNGGGEGAAPAGSSSSGSTDGSGASGAPANTPQASGAPGVSTNAGGVPQANAIEGVSPDSKEVKNTGTGTDKVYNVTNSTGRVESVTYSVNGDKKGTLTLQPGETRTFVAGSADLGVRISPSDEGGNTPPHVVLYEDGGAANGQPAGVGNADISKVDGNIDAYGNPMNMTVTLSDGRTAGDGNANHAYAYSSDDSASMKLAGDPSKTANIVLSDA